MTPPTARVKCTYEDCHRYFSSAEAMIKHKVEDKARGHTIHDFYCKRCDEDCNDDAEFLLHQLLSSNHICCPLCGQEFMSQGGRDRHVQLKHPTKQNLACPSAPGCPQRFTSVASLLSHIEKNECSVIPSDYYVKHRAERQIEKDVWSQTFDPLVGTGIPSQEEFKTTTDILDNSRVYLDKKQDDSKAKLLSDSDSDSNGLSQHPSLLPSTGDQTQEMPSSADNIPRYQPNQHITTIPHNAVPKTYLSNAEKYYNPIEKIYTCPGLRCGEKFTSHEAFESHLLYGNHATGIVRCPCCHRTFKSTTGLMAHCESPSLKCRVRETEDYENVLKEITAGMVALHGLRADGTMELRSVPVGEW